MIGFYIIDAVASLFLIYGAANVKPHLLQSCPKIALLNNSFVLLNSLLDTILDFFVIYFKFSVFIDFFFQFSNLT